MGDDAEWTAGERKENRLRIQRLEQKVVALEDEREEHMMACALSQVRGVPSDLEALAREACGILHCELPLVCPACTRIIAVLGRVDTAAREELAALGRTLSETRDALGASESDCQAQEAALAAIGEAVGHTTDDATPASTAVAVDALVDYLERRVSEESQRADLAQADARLLAHAYRTDNRPPESVVVRVLWPPSRRRRGSDDEAQGGSGRPRGEAVG